MAQAGPRLGHKTWRQRPGTMRVISEERKQNGSRAGRLWGRCSVPAAGLALPPHLPTVATKGLLVGAGQTARGSGRGTVEGGPGRRRRATPFTRLTTLSPQAAPTATNPDESQCRPSRNDEASTGSIEAVACGPHGRALAAGGCLRGDPELHAPVPCECRLIKPQPLGNDKGMGLMAPLAPTHSWWAFNRHDLDGELSGNCHQMENAHTL